MGKVINKGIQVLGFVTFVFLSAAVISAESSDKHLYQYTLNPDKTATINDYYGTQKVIQIPEVLENHTVTSIAPYAFNQKGITDITIPSSVLEIGEFAFSACKSLKTVTFTGDGLSIIGRNAFSECSRLDKLVLPNSVSSIDVHAFMGTSALKQITIPGNITEIKSWFYNSNVKRVILSEGVTTIKKSAFNSKKAIEITIPRSLKKVEMGSMYKKDTVICYQDSPAYYFAINNGIKYKLMGPHIIQTKKSLYVGQKYSILVKNKAGNITWKSANKKIAKVNKSGEVTAMKKGKVNITILNSGVILCCKITVREPYMNKSKAAITQGNKTNLKLVGAIGEIHWRTSNKKVAKVSRDGLVIAKSAGKATITAVYKNKTYFCKLTVGPKSKNL